MEIVVCLGVFFIVLGDSGPPAYTGVKATMKLLESTGQMSILEPSLLNNTIKAKIDLIFFNRVPKVGSQTLMELMRILSMRNNFGFHQDRVQREETIRLSPEDQAILAALVSNYDPPRIYIKHVCFRNVSRTSELIALMALSTTLFLYIHTRDLNAKLKEMEIKIQPVSMISNQLVLNMKQPQELEKLCIKTICENINNLATFIDQSPLPWSVTCDIANKFVDWKWKALNAQAQLGPYSNCRIIKCTRQHRKETIIRFSVISNDARRV